MLSRAKATYVKQLYDLCIKKLFFFNVGSKFHRVALLVSEWVKTAYLATLKLQRSVVVLFKYKAHAHSHLVWPTERCSTRVRYWCWYPRYSTLAAGMWGISPRVWLSFTRVCHRKASWVLRYVSVIRICTILPRCIAGSDALPGFLGTSSPVLRERDREGSGSTNHR